MTREHRAWEMLIRRLDYLNTFGGNRSEMENTTRIVEQIWDDTGHDEEPEDPYHYPVENIGFDNTGEVLHEEGRMIIKFSSDYPKLHGQTTAELLAVKPIRIDKDTPKELLEYDTKKVDGTYYKLRTGDYIQLIFLGNLGIPFCTIRSKRNRFAEDKEIYYKQFVGKFFEIIKEDV